MSKTTIQVVVGARNASGEPELVKVNVECTEEQINDGTHYDLASDEVAGEGYEVTTFVFDEHDRAWRQMSNSTEESLENICAQIGVTLIEATEDEIKGRWDWTGPRGNASDMSLDTREDAARNAVEFYFPKRDWIYEVENGDTTRGYLGWANDKAVHYAAENISISDAISFDTPRA